MNHSPYPVVIISVIHLETGEAAHKYHFMITKTMMIKKGLQLQETILQYAFNVYWM